MNKSLGGESGSVECSITLRGGTQLLLFASIGFFLGAGNFQDWFQGDQKNLKSISEGFKNDKNKNGWINPSRLAGWSQSGSEIQPKKNCFQKKYKDDQNGLIHPEN